MAAIKFKGRALEMADGQSVLDALLAAGEQHPYSCRTGACQACLARVCSGSPPAAWQAGLSETLKARGFFLACQATCPPEDVEITGADDLPQFQLRLEQVDRVASNIAILRLTSDTPIDYEPGQFIQVSRGDGLTRSYSLASAPGGPYLELHIRRVDGGAMSEQLFAAAPGLSLRARGPGGSCFYVAGRPEQPILLAGTGTGLAPLLGIARRALSAGHTGPITLVHGALVEEGLYASETLSALARAHENFTYIGCVKNRGAGDANAHVTVGDVSELVLSLARPIQKGRFFLCGAPDIVTGLRKKLFLAGVSLKDILADAFVTR